jgi:hypothetical protein
MGRLNDPFYNQKKQANEWQKKFESPLARRKFEKFGELVFGDGTKRVLKGNEIGKYIVELAQKKGSLSILDLEKHFQEVVQMSYGKRMMMFNDKRAVFAKPPVSNELRDKDMSALQEMGLGSIRAHRGVSASDQALGQKQNFAGNSNISNFSGGNPKAQGGYALTNKLASDPGKAKSSFAAFGNNPPPGASGKNKGFSSGLRLN